MKKTILILSTILLLSSCSKEQIKQQGQVKYNLNGYTHYNTKLEGIKFNPETNYIQYNFKINDSMNGVFVLSTERQNQYCHSAIITKYSNGEVLEDLIDYRMNGKYYVSANVVNGMFLNNAFNYIDFTNYNLF